MIFEFTSKPNFDFIAEFVAKFKIPIRGNSIAIPASIGKGSIKIVEFGEGYAAMDEYNIIHSDLNDLGDLGDPASGTIALCLEPCLNLQPEFFKLWLDVLTQFGNDEADNTRGYARSYSLHDVIYEGAKIKVRNEVEDDPEEESGNPITRSIVWVYFRFHVRKVQWLADEGK